MDNHRSTAILLVEDDEVDVMNVRRAFQRNNFSHPVYVAHDGVAALEMLRGRRRNEMELFPRIVLLDLNLPRMNGIEFVNQIKRHQELKSIPVIIVSYKDKEEDRLAGLQAGANYYLTKSSFEDDSLIRATASLIGEA